MMIIRSGAAGRHKRVPYYAPVEGGITSGNARPFSVLIVEDDYFVALGLEQSLMDAGFKVAGIAVTVEEAMDLGSRERPDLAIVDIRLAGERDGIEAAIELRWKHSIPCIFATAHGDELTKSRAQKAEPLAWFTKPYAPEDVVSAVKAVLTEEK